MDAKKAVLTVQERTSSESDDHNGTEGEDARKKRNNSGFMGCSIDNDDHWRRVGPLNEITIWEIRKRFNLNSKKCVANRRGTPNRCGNFIVALDQESANEKLKELTSRSSPIDEEEYGIELSRLTGLTFCTRHHKTPALQRINSWSSKVAFKKAQSRKSPRSATRTKFEPHSSTTLTEIPATTVLAPTTRSECNENGLHSEIHDTAPLVPKKPRRVSKLDKASEPPIEAIHIRVSSFLPYIPLKQRNKTVKQIIEETVSRNLVPREQKAGHLYMYRHSGAPGRIKIGVTTKSTQERVKGWERKCGRKIELLYPTQFDLDKAAVPHCYLVEALVHAELVSYRREVPTCPVCRRGHREWFEVDSEFAEAIIRRWSEWMRQGPYEEVGLEYPHLGIDGAPGTFWRLKATNLKTMYTSQPVKQDHEYVSVTAVEEFVQIPLRRNSRLAKRA